MDSQGTDEWSKNLSNRQPGDGKSDKKPDRPTDRQKDGETDRPTDRTDRRADRPPHNQKDRPTDKQGDRQTDEQADRPPAVLLEGKQLSAYCRPAARGPKDRRTDGQTDPQTAHGHTDRLANRQNARPTAGPSDTQTVRHTR